MKIPEIIVMQSSECFQTKCNVEHILKTCLFINVYIDHTHESFLNLPIKYEFSMQYCKISKISFQEINIKLHHK